MTAFKKKILSQIFRSVKLFTHYVLFFFTVAPIPEPGEINTVYNVIVGSEYEINFQFSLTPKLTVLKWYYGSNFQERSNIIDIPSESIKFAASIIVRHK